MAKLEDVRRNYRYRQNEIFKRMKITTFVQLVLQVNAIQKLEDDADSFMPDSVRSEQETPTNSVLQENDKDRDSPAPSLALTEGDYGDVANVQTPRSTLQSVIRGVGEFDLEEQGDSNPPMQEVKTVDPHACPYLLLDIRDQDAYDNCHLITAKSYPVAMLSRSYNNYTPDIIAYRNKPGKIIVIYDEDERIGTGAATTFSERGFDNLFLLSGGLKVAAGKFPEGLVTGTIPLSCRPPPPPSRGRKKQPQQIEQIKACKTEFSNDDLEKLDQHLDENLIPQDTGSRLSRASTRATSNASMSSINTSRSTSSIHSNPWK
uniref:Centrosomal protein of 41 kDa-like n=1 Tax=Saccoglossus kowalevskii TaxID=10224 RepID=A0ABM0MTZ7_SACKO|nr:PREDICTED: centrosomal protein of 41 kDa-like [Saccoglossus kowalevskii]